MRTYEQSREIQSFCDFYWQSHTEDWNQIPDEFLTRNVLFDLNYNESAALTYAHVKRCKLHKEADIAVPQSSTDWSIRSATGTTSSVKENGVSTTEGTESVVFKAEGKMVGISPQQTISCNTTDDDCIEGDLITVFNYVMVAESI